MKKTLTKILSVMLIVCITFTAVPLSGLVGLELPKWLGLSVNASSDKTTVTTGYWSDSGNYDTSWYYKNQYASVYTLNSASELAGLSVLVNNGHSFKNKTIKLGTDINLYDHYWTPIGKYVSAEDNKPFAGTFDGQGNTISFLLASGDYSALFSYISDGATIKNISFENIALSGTNYVAGVVAYADADNSTVSINNCHIINGKIRDDIIADDYDASEYTAGIVAYLTAIDGYASIVNCTNYVDITCDDYGAGIVGCVLGGKSWSSSTKDKNIIVQNCHNYGDIYSGDNTQYCGGITGYATKTKFKQCTNHKDVLGDAYSDDDGSLWYAGIAGHGYILEFLDCANYGTIKSWVVAGITCAHNDVVATNCLNTGEMVHISMPDGEGHAISRYGIFENCYYLSGSGFAPGIGWGSSYPNNIGTTSISLNSLKSGAICFKLNNSTASGEVVWGQNIDNGETIQDYPVIGGAKVYYISGKYTNAPDHILNDGVITKEPTCSEYGVLTFTCQDCGFTFDESIKMIEHSYNNGTITTEPTCNSSGIKTFKCIDCGSEYTDRVYSLGHDYDDGVIITEATCTQTGKEEISCLRCDYKYTRTISSHKYDDGVVTSNPTCTQNGVTTFTCEDCGKTKTNSISKTGHSFDDGVVTSNPTCTADGNILYTCTICNYSYNSKTYKYYHSYNYNDYTVTKEPTCTETGIKTYACVRCKQTTTSTISTLPHKYDIGIITKKATCTSDGTKKFTCQDCGNIKTETIKAYNHINNVLIDSSYYPESNHVYNDNISESKTFTWNGALSLKVTFSSDTLVEYDYDEIYIYNDYGKEIGKYTSDELAGDTITIPGDSFTIKLVSDFAVTKYGYSIDSIVADMSGFSEWKVVSEPTCGEPGMKKRTCSLCNIEESNEIPAFNHYNQHIIDSSYYLESKHDYANNLNESKTFTWEGAEKLFLVFSSKTMTENNYDYIYLYDSNGLEIGKYTGSSLSGKKIIVDGDTFTIKLTSDYSGIKYGYSFDSIIAYESAVSNWEIVKKPTCAESGQITRKCSLCDYEESDVLSKIGHIGEESSAEAPTCTETGLTAGVKCSVCGESLTLQETIPALGHDIIIDEAVNPDCINTGLTVGEHCSRCDYKVEQTVVEALGHKYGSMITEPTCTERGYTTYNCTVCGDTYTGDYVDALGHTDGDVVEENYVAPTCTANGSKENVSYCTVCNAETSRETITVPALGHTEEEIHAVEPTCTETGLTTGVKCSVCNEILESQQTIPALGHDIITDYAVSPNCTNTGLTAGEHCSLCDYKVEQTVVDALGHKYESVITVPTCTSQGYTTYTCHCGDTYTGDYVDALAHNYKDGICIDCETPDPTYFTFDIQQPSRTTIRCNDGIKLHTKITGKLPDGSRIEWSKNNNNFNMTTSASGNEITIISKNNGYTTFTATVYDADNNVIAQDTIEMYSKAGLFDKIGGFFRSLFGMTKIYEN